MRGVVGVNRTSVVKQLSFESPLYKGIVFHRQYGLREHALTSRGCLPLGQGDKTEPQKDRRTQGLFFGGYLFGWHSVNRIYS